MGVKLGLTLKGRACIEGVSEQGSEGIFGPKREREREEVAEGWRKLHNEELHNLYTSRSHADPSVCGI
jgi:hypothetical protein